MDPEDATTLKRFWEAWGWGLVLVLAGLASYSNCFQGEFVFDDNGGILGNPHITHLWPLSSALSSPARTTTAGRPVICLTLALNYAFCGLQIWGYRAVNLGIHLLAGLALFGIVRRTLKGTERAQAWAGEGASALAFSATLLWLLHPLHTQVVNYVIQRSESVMALCYLLTLYCSIRAFEELDGAGGMAVALWQCAAVAACALGMGSKEVMVSAPVIVLLYDKIFVSAGFSNAFKRSRFLYAGLAATWLILGYLVLRGDTASGARLGRLAWGPMEYALTQAGVILHYLQLAFWPDPLCFDYAWPAAHSVSTILPGAVVVTALLGGTVWALFRKPEIGFLGAWFFALLAPSSSVMPLPDMAVEYRTYLALAAVMVFFVVAGYELLENLGQHLYSIHGKWGHRAPLMAGATICAIAAILFGVLTFLRNADYHSAIALWRDTTIKRPENARSHVNLGIALASANKLGDATVELLAASRLDPQVESLHLNLGCVLAMQGRQQDALPHFEEAVRENPGEANGYYNLGNSLSDLGRKAEAAEAYRIAIKLNPDYRDAHFNYGVDLQQQGKLEEAARHFSEASRIDPQYAPSEYMLGLVFAKAGRTRDAAKHFNAALAIDPGNKNARAELLKLQQ